MSSELEHYTGVFAPDLTDPRPASAGQVSGGVGVTSLANALDMHNHGPGRGVGVSISSAVGDGTLDMADNEIDGVTVLRYGSNYGAIPPTTGRTIYWEDDSTLRMQRGPIGGSAALVVAALRDSQGAFFGDVLSGAWTRQSSGRILGTSFSGVYMASVGTLPVGRQAATLRVYGNATDSTSKVELLRNGLPVGTEVNSFAISPGLGSGGDLSGLTIDDAMYTLRATCGPAETAFAIEWWQLVYTFA